MCGQRQKQTACTRELRSKRIQKVYLQIMYKRRVWTRRNSYFPFHWETSPNCCLSSQSWALINSSPWTVVGTCRLFWRWGGGLVCVMQTKPPLDCLSISVQTRTWHNGVLQSVFQARKLLDWEAERWSQTVRYTDYVLLIGDPVFMIHPFFFTTEICRLAADTESQTSVWRAARWPCHSNLS